MNTTERPSVLGLGTAVPEFVVDQKAARAMAQRIFASAFRDVERLMTVFENGRIQERRVVLPPEAYLEPMTWPERNALYFREARRLGAEAAEAALADARLPREDIAGVVFVSTTGLATPSLDSWLIKDLNLSRHATRLPVWGLGCAGGASGLNRAADMSVAHDGRPVLLVAVELCSLTFQPDDPSKSNLIATSLFADGAAAVLVGAGEGPRLLGGHSTLFDGTEDIMGWDVNEAGLKVRFSRDVPTLVREVMSDDLNLAASSLGLRRQDLRHFVTHPGGLKVLQAFTDALDLPAEALADSLAVLERYGNMSSVSVLFVLERFLRRWPELPSGELGVITAMGPGFSAEHAFFRT